MTVKELKEILNNVEDENMVVKQSGYCSYEIKGYYFDADDNGKYMMLTNLNVQPRV